MTANLQQTPPDTSGTTHESLTVESTTTLALLGDDHACEIIRTLEGEALAARELVERCEMSRPTVYRRLDRLTDAGIVAAEMALGADGHHRKEFSLAIDSVAFEIGADGIDAFSPR